MRIFLDSTFSLPPHITRTTRLRWSSNSAGPASGGGHQPVSVEEARRNIARKFPACRDRLEALLNDIAPVADSPGISCPASLAETNQPIFRAVLGCRVEMLLTGDIRDFGFLMNAPEKTGDLLIQTVAEFLARR